MGEVYRALDTKLNRQVAIKVLPEAYASDPDRVARFHREAQAIAALNHPNIASIYDLAESGSTKYLVLELIEGETLADRLRRGPVPPEDALLIIRQVLEALEVAHERGICHRDLKPANIKITNDGVVKVLDFGLAKFMQTPGAQPLLTNSPTLSVAGTYPGVILGTAGYMSPEQAKGYEADHRSDLFSVGCILYELLSGHQAFEGETASEILAGVLKSDVDFSRLPPRLNPRLIDVLKRCLEKTPKKRWHAAADVRVEVESVIGRAAVVADPSRPADPRPWWRRAAPVAVALVVGALLAAPAAWLLKPDPPGPLARFDVPLPEGHSLTGAGRNLVGVSPNGEQIVYTANNRLYIRSLSELVPREIDGTSLGTVSLSPVFSPDGENIAFWSQSDNTIKRIARSGGAPVTVCAAPSVWGMTWTDHGILFGQAGKAVMLVSPNGGTATQLAEAGDGEIIASPFLFPAGDALLFAVRNEAQSWESANIVVQEVRGGRRTILIEGGADPRLLPTGHLVFARSGSLLAVRLDMRNRRLVGGPVPVIEGIRRGAQSPTGPTGVAHFSYSNDGVLVYLPGPSTASGESSSQYDLAIFDAKGIVKPLGLPPREYRAPRVSPDGRFVAFFLEDEREAAVWTHEIAGERAPLRLTFGGKNRHPVWSGDGRWVIFQSDRDGDLAIFRQLADNSGEAQRLTKPETDVEHIPLSSSPDGAHLLFATVKGRSDWSLAVLAMADHRIRPFSTIRSLERTDGAFSPDGKFVAYQVREPGSPRRVFVEPFPTTGSKYLIGEGGHPYWSGKEAIILNAGPSISRRIPFLVKPRVGVGSGEQISRAGRVETNPATQQRNVDALPNGRLFGVAGVSSAATTLPVAEIRVVLNWFEEVRQRVPLR